MKKYITIIAILLLVTPSQAHAGFLLGYMMGASGNNNQAQVSPITNIPPACFFVKSAEEYQSCRSKTAFELYSNREGVKEHFMQVEYENIILPLQKRETETTK